MDSDAIRCIFYSEFHDEFGPRAIYQVPEDFISKDDFDMMHAHIITKRELQNHIVSNNILDYKVVGCPMHVELPYKPRNALIFNMCFVFDANVCTYLYEMAIKKMGSYLRQLEKPTAVSDNYHLTRDYESQVTRLRHPIDKVTSSKDGYRVAVSDKRGDNETVASADERNFNRAQLEGLLSYSNQ